MTLRGSALSWLASLVRNLFSGGRRDAELRSDIDTYVDMLVDEKIAAGLTPEAARRSTLIEIGSAEDPAVALAAYREGNKERARKSREAVKARLEAVPPDARASAPVPAPAVSGASEGPQGAEVVSLAERRRGWVWSLYTQLEPDQRAKFDARWLEKRSEAARRAQA